MILLNFGWTARGIDCLSIDFASYLLFLLVARLFLKWTKRGKVALLSTIETINALIATMLRCVKNPHQLRLINLVLLAIRGLVTHLSACVADRRLLVIFVHHVVIVTTTVLRLRRSLPVSPVLHIRKVSQLLKGALFVNDDRFEMLLLAVGTVRAEAGHVVHTYLLFHKVILNTLVQVLGPEAALRSLVAKSTFVIRTWFRVD